MVLFHQPVAQFLYNELPEDILDLPITEFRVWHDDEGRKGDDWHISLVLQGPRGKPKEFAHISFDTTQFEDGLTFGTEIVWGLTQGVCYEVRNYRELQIIKRTGPSIGVRGLNQFLQSRISYLGLNGLRNHPSFLPHHPSVLFIVAVVQKLEEVTFISDSELETLLSTLDRKGFNATYFYYHRDVVLNAPPL